MDAPPASYRSNHGSLNLEDMVTPLHQEDQREPLSQPAPSGPTSGARRLLHLILPFFKLHDAADEPCWTCWRRCNSTRGARKIAEVFLVVSGLWLVALVVADYLLLAISSTTFVLEDVGKNTSHVFKTQRKDPKIGQEYVEVILAKWIASIVLMHHICGNLMEPSAEMRRVHTQDMHLMKPLGVLHATRRACSSLFCCRCCRRRARQEEEQLRWFNSFIADFLLLIFSGAMMMLYQFIWIVLKLIVHYNEERSQKFLTGVNSFESPVLIVFEGLLGSYVSLLVMGFLTTTLADTVVAKWDRKFEFAGVLGLFIILWATNFLTVLFDRQVYTSPWVLQGLVPNISWVKEWLSIPRIIVAFAQVFVTHSSVMLGAVLCGHSAHFKRCPDLMKDTFYKKVLPVMILYGVAAFLLFKKRLVHDHASCNPTQYNIFALHWPLVYTLFTVLSGAVLLFLALCKAEPAQHSALLQEEGTVHHDAADSSAQAPARTTPGQEPPHERENVFLDLDYDSSLVYGTLFAALLYYVTIFYEYRGEKLVGSSIASAFELLAPFGLAAFTLTVWKHPPRRDSLAGAGLWFAVFFAAVQFTVFQEKEDCELASTSPGCCNYPWFSDYNQKHHRDFVCNKDFRCTQMSLDSFIDEELYCQQPPAQEHLSMVTLDAHTTPEFNSSFCEELSLRWEQFSAFQQGTDYSPAMQEAENHIEKQSMAYRLFFTVGQAACVEFYFTIFGVLLKTIFLTQHEKSEEILKLDQHKHCTGPSNGQVPTANGQVPRTSWVMPMPRSERTSSA